MMFYIAFYYICFLSTVSLKILVLASNSRPTFVPRRIAATTNNVSSKSSSSKLSSSISSLPTSSNFLSEKDAKIFESLVAVITVFRGGGNNDYYDDRGHQNDNYYPSSSSSSQPYSEGGDYNDGRYGGADDEDRYYDDRGTSQYDDRGDGGGGRQKFTMPDIIRKGNRKIGLPLLGIGATLTLIGVSLFFNKMLMRLGNLFFVAGVPMTIGPGRTAGYFFQPKKARATACLSLGIILVFAGWPISGILLEVFGFINLFGNMFPFAFAIMKQMPFIGPLLKGNLRKKDDNDSNSSRDYSSRNSNNQYDDYDERDRDRYDDEPYYNGGGYNDNNDNNSYY